MFDHKALIERLQAVVYVVRRRQINQLLATLTVVSFGVGEYLRREWKELHWALLAAYVAYGTAAACLIWLAWRLWKVAAPPPEVSDRPVSSAIKGLLPWGIADGELFARLGRRAEIGCLLGLAQNDQIPITVVRGESGAGKTSLLQAGLRFALGPEHCVYWEALATGASTALMHAVHSQFPDLESIDSLPAASRSRWVLCLDQFEQLHAGTPEHLPVFNLLERLAKEPGPHKLSVVIGFRREYTADWLDFEQAHGFRAEQVAVNLMRRTAAADVIAILANKAGFALDQELVNDLVVGIAQPQGVSPLDLSVGLESLARFAQQRGLEQVRMSDYRLSGGAEGLLLTFVQEKLEEVPEILRAPLLKGIVLTLVDLATNQRVAEGATAAAIAANSECPTQQLVPWLDRLALRGVRLLEPIQPDRYRLPHDRLVPVLRRLTGTVLASLDQTRLLFEVEYQRWQQTSSRRYLLRGKELADVLRHLDQLVPGEGAAGKTEYLDVCLGRRKMLRLIAVGAVVATVGAGYLINKDIDTRREANKLRAWGLPPELLVAQDKLDGLIIEREINDLGWLSSRTLQELACAFSGENVAPLKLLKALSSVRLIPVAAETQNLADLELPSTLTSLSLSPFSGQVRSLNSQWPRSLTLLSLDLTNAEASSIAELQLPQTLTSLSLTVSNEVTNLADLDLKLPQTLTALSLAVGADVESLGDLQLPPRLALFDLKLGEFETLPKLAACKWLPRIPSVSLTIKNGLSSPRPADLIWPPNLVSLSLSDSGFSGSLASLKLPEPRRLTSLSLNSSQLDSLADQELQQNITRLLLDLSSLQAQSLADLQLPQSITSLSLKLSLSNIRSLSEMQWPSKVNSLSLDLQASKVKELSELERLKTALTSLELKVSAELLPEVARLSYRDKISVWLDAVEPETGPETIPKLPDHFKFLSLRFPGFNF